MMEADEDQVGAAPADPSVPCAPPEESPSDEWLAGGVAVPSVETGPQPPAWLEEFFSYATWKKLIRIARRVGARSHSEAVEAVNATLHDVGVHAEHIKDPLRYARKALQHHVPRERHRLERAGDLAAAGAGTAERVDDPGFRVLEDVDWVMSVLQTLPPAQQKVMALYYDGFSVTEIAEGLGVARTNVTSNLRLARINLTKHEEIARLHRRASPDRVADQRRSAPGPERGLEPRPPRHAHEAGFDPGTDATSPRKE
jgi:DNA-directed RNA polymerase specialized sigma24 family protein